MKKRVFLVLVSLIFLVPVIAMASDYTNSIITDTEGNLTILAGTLYPSTCSFAFDSKEGERID
jgi:hypothetical protein